MILKPKKGMKPISIKTIPIAKNKPPILLRASRKIPLKIMDPKAAR